MSWTADTMAELSVLGLFRLDSAHEGIKIRSSAEPAIIVAAERLFDKGLLTQKDGGYLTPLGLEAAQHAQTLQTMLAATSS